jgi:hypothetical protein
MARSTFSIFATLFALSLYLVLPDQSSRVRALVVIAAGVVGAYRTIRIRDCSIAMGPDGSSSSF